MEGLRKNLIKQNENIVADTRDRLVTKLKEENGFSRHYRRRGEWILCNNEIEKIKKNE